MSDHNNMTPIFIPLDNTTFQKTMIALYQTIVELGGDVLNITYNNILIYWPIRYDDLHLNIKISTIEGQIKLEFERFNHESIEDLEPDFFENIIREIESGIPKNRVSNSPEVWSRIEQEFISKLNKNNKLQKTLLEKEEAQPRLEHWHSFFTPNRIIIVTPILLLINLLIFILMVCNGVHIINPDISDILEWGANSRIKTISGEWWRLMSSNFIHVGIIHLFFNFFSLLFIGWILENIIGSFKTLFAYCMSCVASSVMSLWWSELSVSAGASGAIFGLYGVFLVILLTQKIKKEMKIAFGAATLSYLVFNLLQGLTNGENIDNAAHIGGLISGIIIGIAYTYSIKNEYKLLATIGTYCGIVLIFTLTLIPIARSIKSDLPIYDKFFNYFIAYETEALKVYDRYYQSHDDIKYTMLHEGLYYWNLAKNALDSIEKYDVPDKIKEQNQSLKKYCDLRIASYYVYINSKDSITNDEKRVIDSLHIEIDKILDDYK